MASRKRKKTKKDITITLNRFRIVQIVLFFLISLSWTFILGVLTGRGYFDKYLNFFRRERSVHSYEKKDKVIKKSIESEDLEFLKNFTEDQLKKKSKAESKKGSESFSQEKYIFQVAAFRDRKKAIEIKNALKRYGFDSKIIPTKIKGYTWYRVHVYLTGSIDKEVKLREKLKLLGLGKPVAVEKE